MAIDPQDPPEALETVERTTVRARRDPSYAGVSPPLIIWGVVWIAANGLAELWPDRPGRILLSAVVVGVAATILVTRGSAEGRRALQRFLLALVAVAVFIASALAILPRLDGVQTMAFVSLMAALMLTMAGIWGDGSRRLVMLGFVLTAAIVGGNLLLPDYRYLSLWFGLAGGGALVLTGLWMRKA